MPKGIRTSDQQAKWIGSVSARTPSKSKRIESNTTDQLNWKAPAQLKTLVDDSRLYIIYVISGEFLDGNRAGLMLFAEAKLNFKEPLFDHANAAGECGVEV